MSILDIDEHSKNFDLHVCIAHKHGVKSIFDGLRLKNDELSEIKNLIHIVDLLPSQFEPFTGFIPAFSIRHQVEVRLSPEKPTLSHLHKEIIEGHDKIANIPLLGEFCKTGNTDDKIVLYINNIKEVGENNWGWLLTAVYIHELYHAYFNTQNYIAEVEEPLAELGALYTLKLMETLNIFDEGICDYYQKEVNKKIGPIYFYGFGKFIYDSVEDFMRIGNFIENFRTDSSNILNKQNDIDNYKKVLHPSTANDAYKLFCSLLGVKEKK